MQKTHFGLRNVWLEPADMARHASLSATVRTRRRKKREKGIFPALHGDIRQLNGFYRTISAYTRDGRDLPPCADLLLDSFYTVEKTIVALEDSKKALQSIRLPVCAESERTGLPRIYMLAADLVGHRNGAIDGEIIEQYVSGFQSVGPLSIRELSLLPDMLKVALIKLLAELSYECMATIKDWRAADDAANSLLRPRPGSDRQIYSIIERLDPANHPSCVEKLHMRLVEADAFSLFDAINIQLKMSDTDLDAVLSAERARQTKSRLLVQNIIHSLRTLEDLDFESLFERMSSVEKILSGDQIYVLMDRPSRAYYRSCIERIADKLEAAEAAVARRALDLASKGDGKASHVGYYLLPGYPGEENLYRSIRPDVKHHRLKNTQKLILITAVQVFIAAILLMLAYTEDIVSLLFALSPAIYIAMLIVGRLSTKFVKPKAIPRLSMECGIGEANRTLIAVPTLITNESSLKSAIEKLETHFLANPLDNCYFALLSDFPDSRQEITPEEEAILGKARSLIEGLNSKYPAEIPIFYCMHRSRTMNSADGIWMGYERKRGAIVELVRLLCTGDTGSFKLMMPELPDKIQYCLTLDADTSLPMETLKELIGAAAHPLNAPVISEDMVVVDGYGVMAPRMETTAKSAVKTPFSSIWSADCGVSAYTSGVSNFSQDIFGTGIFGGKGIFNISVFKDTLDYIIPDNTVLSHDLLEGCFMRAGFLNDVILYDSEPSTLLSWWKRQHRWIRGDWQLLPFMFKSTRDAAGSKVKNPLDTTSRYKMADNLSRSLMLPYLLVSLGLGLIFSKWWVVILSLAALLFDIVSDLVGIIADFITNSVERDFSGMLKDRVRSWLKPLINLTILPFCAYISIDAIIRSLYRMFISHKRMLEWQTAADAESRRKGNITGYYSRMASCPIVGFLAVLAAFLPGASPLCLLFGLTWLLSPLMVCKLDKAYDKKPLSDGDVDELIKLARCTWRYFDEFCTVENNYLPPDNYQESPVKPLVRNTSPTNIGMGLMAVLSAFDMKLIDEADMCTRLENMLNTIERMDKWHGHLYNWYNIRTLSIVEPKYVSTVDSGNLVACFLTLGKAMSELESPRANLISKRCFKLARETDFTALCDKQRKLMHIGYDFYDGKLSPSRYDLLASEARLSGFVAIALGQIKKEYWFKLGRLLVGAEGGRALISWSGTMFEYLMPVIFTGTIKGTLLGETCSNVVNTQIKHTKGKIPWGISESGYYAFDRSMFYQYRAFGIPKLGLSPTREPECVIAPYATMLALLTDPQAALKNIYDLIKLGALGEFGCYEALDFTNARLRKNRKYEIVKSYMAHHQGMSLCSFNNVVNDNILKRRFMGVPEVKAAELLLEEKRPKMSVVLKTFESAVYRKRNKRNDESISVRQISPNHIDPKTQVLSNGNYSVLLAENGMGFSKCDDIMLNRWRNDPLRSDSGVHFLIRDGASVWSPALLPVNGAASNYCTVYEPHKAAFSSNNEDLSAAVDICVAPDFNGEIRRMTIINHGERQKELEVGAFMEVCLAEQAEDASHPAFVRLTVDARLEDDILLFNRRPRPQKPEHWLYFSLIGPAKTRYCADRLIMPGRGADYADAMRRPMLPNQNVESPIEPTACGRMSFLLNPGESAVIELIMGYASNREQAISDLHELTNSIPRLFDLAWSHAASAYRMAGIDMKMVDMYESIISRLFIRHSTEREHHGNSGLGIKGLWRLGISGDKPILLVKVRNTAQIRTVKALLKLSDYMDIKNCQADIVLLGKYPNEYKNELRERLTEMLAGYGTRNVFLIHEYDLDENELFLLSGVATFVIDAGKSMKVQLTPQRHDEIPDRRYLQLGQSRAAFTTSDAELLFYNGYGGFDADRGEYVIRLKPGATTPLPWSNIMTNDRFGTLVTEIGGGFTWNKNSRENKLTPWANDPVSDRKGEFVILTDADTGESWTITAGPLQRDSECTVRYGFGYTVYGSSTLELRQNMTVFVDHNKPVKYTVIELANPMMRRRNIDILYGAEWVLGAIQHPEAILTEYRNGVLLASNLRQDGDGNEFAYIAMPNSDAEYSSDRSFILNAGWHKEALNKKCGLGLGGFSALRTRITLEAGESRELVLMLGQDTEENIHKAVKESVPSYVQSRLNAVKRSWSLRLGHIEVKTGDPAFDLIMNGHLLYQVLSSRLMGRTGYYQCSGAYGFRDQLQDTLALLMTEPEIAREHILLCASKQFEAGDVLHWWHEGGAGIRTMFSDDRLFLPYSLLKYLEVTNDMAILDEVAPYLADVPIEDGKTERFMDPVIVSDISGTLYDHCLRAIRRSMRTGEHGLPLMEGGDWNDGMDLVGENGGESVWLGWFLLYILERFIPLCSCKRDSETAAEFTGYAGNLRSAIEAHGWDGSWYKRAFLFDGTPLGSHENEQCSIDCISQSWSVFNKAAHGAEAMDSLDSLLVDEENGVIKLLSPPFNAPERDMGYIQSYLPGVRENGGQYTHAGAWAVIAACMLTQPDRAMKLFKMLNPIDHTSQETLANKYKAEPYVAAGDIYSVGRNAGRSGWTWYTGAASWMYQAGLEYMLGLKKVGNELYLKPCVPYEKFEIKYRFGKSLYEITAEKASEYAMEMDGQRTEKILLIDDGKNHKVKVFWK